MSSETKKLPINPGEIGQSAEYVQAMLYFARGAALPLMPTPENISLIEQYAALVTQYGEYCVSALSEERIIRQLMKAKNRTDIISFPSFPTDCRYNQLYESVFLEKDEKDKTQIRFNLMMRTKRGEFPPDMQSLIDGQCHAQDASNTWTTSSKDDHANLDDFVIHEASRRFEPTDLVAHPQLLTPFVRGITTIFANAQRELLGSSDYGQNAAEQRVKSIVTAFQQANKILAPVVLPPGKKG